MPSQSQQIREPAYPQYPPAPYPAPVSAANRLAYTLPAGYHAHSDNRKSPAAGSTDAVPARMPPV